MTLSDLWLRLTRGPQEPYQPVQAYVYREGMQAPDRRYDPVPGMQAKETEAEVKKLLAADRKPKRVWNSGRIVGRR